MKALKTAAAAAKYAKFVEEITGKKHLVFQVPEGTAAYDYGYRYATCEEQERPVYEAGGAKFVEVAK